MQSSELFLHPRFEHYIRQYISLCTCTIHVPAFLKTILFACFFGGESCPTRYFLFRGLARIPACCGLLSSSVSVSGAGWRGLRSGSGWHGGSVVSLRPAAQDEFAGCSFRLFIPHSVMLGFVHASTSTIPYGTFYFDIPA